MGIELKEYKDFAYFRYHRLKASDFTDLKRKIDELLLSVSEKRDIIFDFSSCNGLISAELTAVVRVLNAFKGTTRFLKIVGNPKVVASIKSVNLGRVENLVIYPNQKAFVEALQKSTAVA